MTVRPLLALAECRDEQAGKIELLGQHFLYAVRRARVGLEEALEGDYLQVVVHDSLWLDAPADLRGDLDAHAARQCEQTRGGQGEQQGDAQTSPPDAGLKESV